jgi:hypothetical protein
MKVKERIMTESVSRQNKWPCEGDGRFKGGEKGLAKRGRKPDASE